MQGRESEEGVRNRQCGRNLIFPLVLNRTNTKCDCQKSSDPKRMPFLDFFFFFKFWKNCFSMLGEKAALLTRKELKFAVFSIEMSLYSAFLSFSFFLSFFFFFNFLGLYLWHLEVPRQGSDQSCSCWPTPQPQQLGIQAETYTAAHSNSRSLAH